MKRPAIIRVDECEHNVADFPDVLDSGGLGPCIVVGLLFSQRAFMLHTALFTHEVTEQNGRHAFFNQLDREVPITDRASTKALVIGSQVDEEEDKATRIAGIESREAVLGELRSLGFTDIHVQWCPSGHGMIQNLILDTKQRCAFVELIRSSAGGFDLVSRDRIDL